MSGRQNIVVVGGSYVGKLTALSHLFAFPRIGVIPSFEHKAFIPYGSAYFKAVDGDVLPDSLSGRPSSAIRIHRGAVTSVEPTRVILEDGNSIPYEFLVMATGTGRLEAMDKKTGTQIARLAQGRVQKANRIVVVGGGAYGVQVATDIKTYPPTKDKHITLVHSRDRLMNRFGPELHDVVMERCHELGIDVILGNRLVVPHAGFPDDEEEFDVQLSGGGSVKAKMVLTTGNAAPLSSPLGSLAPESIDPITKYIKVKPTLQIDSAIPYDNVFAVGDVADTGAHKAARPGGAQAAIVARNIGKLIRAKLKQGHPKANGGLNGSLPNGSDRIDELDAYKPDVPSIHMSLGLDKGVIFQNSGLDGEGGPIIRHEESKTQDLAALMSYSRWWKMRAEGVEDYFS
ncbi:hypothetical protein V5O48_004294 [Marasmius crinis-equi]|uniref:FAD/NAD(P)-binding domain-containing protein n=1 Tax=Marasmius crinis-equi TaxID=585013 RepID=A0ABR3FQK1_9AGAR